MLYIKKVVSLILVIAVFALSAFIATPAMAVSSGKSPFSNCLKLLAEEKKLTIGYIGGSITYGSSAVNDGGSIELSYVNRVSNWFKEQYPNATIETVNAGVSDTATNFGLFRLEKTLMNTDGHDMPDLVFIEFTVNDWTYNTQTADDLKRQVESIYYNVWKLNPYAEIGIIITATSDTSVPRKAHMEVANHYGVPYVDVGLPLQAAKNERGIPSESAGNYYYTIDNLHPSWRGYEIYFNAIKNNILTKYFGNAAAQNGALYNYYQNMPKQQNKYIIDNPQIITANSLTYSGGGVKAETQLTCNVYGTALTSSKKAIVDNYLKITSNATVTTEFYGTALGVMFMMNNTGVNLTYRIDGGEEKQFLVDSSNFGWQMYSHLQVFMLAHNLSEGKHAVEFSFSMANGMSSMNVQLAGVLANNYKGIIVSDDVLDGSVFVEREITKDFNRIIVTTTPQEGKTLKADGLKYTLNGNTYPIIKRVGAANSDGTFNKNSEAQYSSFEFNLSNDAANVVISAEFVDNGAENIAVIGTSVNESLVSMRFRSRVARKLVINGNEYSIKSTGTLLFKEAQTDLDSALESITNGTVNGKNIRTTQLYDRTDNYYEYVCHINYGTKDSEFLDDDYYAYAYAVYKNNNGDTVRIYSDGVAHSYQDVAVASNNVIA